MTPRTPPEPPSPRTGADRASAERASADRASADRASGDHGRRSRSGAPTLDAASKAIIEQLQEDGRRSYAAIAAAVGLSEAAVRARVQKLTDGGVLQIVAVTDPLHVGFQRQAMVGVKVSGDMTDVASRLGALPEVAYVVITAGSFDILAEVVCEDDEHLLEVISREMRTLPGVAETETFVYLKLNKQHYNWGTR